VLTEQPWRFEAIIRLLAGILTCVFLGSLALTCLGYKPDPAHSSAAAFYGLSAGAFAGFAAALWFVARPWTLDQTKIRAGLLLISVYAGVALSGAAQRLAGSSGGPMTVQGMMVSALSFQGAAIPLLWLFVRQHGWSPVQAFGLARDKRRALLSGATAALAIIPIAIGLQFGITMIAEFLNLKLPAQNAVLILRLADSWTDRIALGVVTVILAPIAEEGLFRGVFYTAIKHFGFPQAALWITSAVFALIHFNTLIFVPLLVLAVVLAKLYERTGNLLSCIACHATFNLFNYVMLFVSSDFGPSGPAQR